MKDNVTDNSPQEEKEEPEVYAVQSEHGRVRFSRRDFLKATGVLAAGTALTGCSIPSLQRPTATITPSATPTRTPTNTPTITPSPTRTLTPTPTFVPGECKEGAKAHKEEVSFVQIAPDGFTLVSISRLEGKIKIWSLPTATLLNSITSGATTAVISPDSTYFVAAGKSNAIRLLSLPGGEVVKTLDGYATTLAISGDGSLLASASESNKIRLWSLPDGKLLKSLDGYAKSMSMSSDGKILVTTEGSGKVKVWLLPDGDLANTFDISTQYVAIHPDGKMFVTGDESNLITAWSLPDGNMLKGLGISSLSAPVFSMDGSLLATGNVVEIMIWSLPDLDPGQGISASATTLSISPHNNLIVLGELEGAIKLRTLPDGEELGCLFDLKVSLPEVEGSEYSVEVDGKTTTFTLPCGAPIPPGAVCVCNCVAGSGCSCVSYNPCSCVGYKAPPSNHYWYPN